MAAAREVVVVPRPVVAFIFQSDSERASQWVDAMLQELRDQGAKDTLVAFNLARMPASAVFAARAFAQVVLLGGIPRGEAPLVFTGAISRHRDLPDHHRLSHWIADMPTDEEGRGHFRAFAQTYIVDKIPPRHITAENSAFIGEHAPSDFPRQTKEEREEEEAERKRLLREHNRKMRQRKSAAQQKAEKDSGDGKQSKNTKMEDFF